MHVKSGPQTWNKLYICILPGGFHFRNTSISTRWQSIGCSVPLQFIWSVLMWYACMWTQPACKVGLWPPWCNHASSCRVAHAGQGCRQLTTHRMRVCSISIVLNSCTSFLRTTQLANGNWRERTTTHASHRCGHHSLSPITVQRGSFSSFKLCS